jgi:hypothetical protein
MGNYRNGEYYFRFRWNIWDSTGVPFLKIEDVYQLITDNNICPEINPF